MGNSDLIFIFNDLITITVLGHKYNNKNHAFEVAIKLYQEWVDNQLQQIEKYVKDGQCDAEYYSESKVGYELKSIKYYTL